MSGDTSTRRRVKLYMLNEDRQWDDRGTGHVSSVYIERLKGMSLLVRSETDGSILLESKIQQDTAYQKQQETLIVWSEAENNYDLALSFQDKSGCDEIWEKICTVQGKDPSVDITQDIIEESEDERFDDVTDGSNPIELPPCELSKLEEISELFSSSVTSPIRREKLAVAIENESYIKKLLDLFHICEDLEDLDGLHQLFAIFKNIFLLNKNALFEVMFTEDCILDIIGVLEYDPSCEQPVKHREYLLHGTHYKDVIPMTKCEIERKIHQTYRVQYIHDVILPMPSVFEENMLSALSSFIFFNKVEIVSVLQEDEKFLTTLFAQLMEDETSDPKRLDLILFLKEFCSFSQTLQPHSRDAFFKTLSTLGILSVIEIILGLDDENVKGAAVDIFSFIVEYSPSMVREFILREGQSTADDEDILINLVIEQMINDTDPELGGAMQLMGILRLLIDPDNMLATANKTEKTEFLSFFYKHSLHVLTAPLFAITSEEKPSNDDYQTAQLLGLILELLTFCVEHHTYHIKNYMIMTEFQVPNDDYQTAQLLGLILELLTFCVEHHTYHIKNYVINKDLLRRVLVLLKSKHAFLALSALRFMRKIIGLKEDFYNRYIIKGNLFQPVIDAYLNNASRYNLKNSAMIELFEFIRTEDIKSFILHIVETYDVTELGAYDCVDTFKALKLRQEQQVDRLKDITASENPMSVLRNNRYRRDARMLDEEEEMYFEQDDDLDNGVPVGDILNVKIDPAHLEFMDNKKVTRDVDTTLDGSPPRIVNRASVNYINISLKSPTSTPNLVTPATSPGSPVVKHTPCITPMTSPDGLDAVSSKSRVGLVDYPDEDSDDEDEEDGTPSKRPRLST